MQRKLVICYGIAASCLFSAAKLSAQQLPNGTDTLDQFIRTAPDSLMATSYATITFHGRALKTILISRGASMQLWVDAKTGRLLVRKGPAGRNRSWWHIVRGVELTR